MSVEHISAVCDRFWAKVDARSDDECWPWIGSRNRDGYGTFGLASRKTVLAHRFAYATTVGEPMRQNVLHRCDNPPCCNPAHLFLGDQAANVADAIAKGRWGHRGPFHKLSLEIHEEIVRAYLAGGISQSALGRKFGVSQATISSIIRQAPGYKPLSRSEAGRRRGELRLEHAEVWA